MLDHYIALIVFCIVSAVTPGPNNIMLMMSSSTFGVRKTLPQYCGVCIGFPLMVFIIGCGLGEIFTKYPLIHHFIRIIGSIYLLYMAWKIIMATTVAKDIKIRKPMTFLKSLLFQWANPKAWVMGIGVFSMYTVLNGTSIFMQVCIISLVFLGASFPSGCVWLFGGAILNKTLKTHIHLRIFNCMMGALLFLSVTLMLFE